MAVYLFYFNREFKKVSSANMLLQESRLGLLNFGKKFLKNKANQPVF